MGCCTRSAPDQCCGLRKVEPLFKAVAGYRVWITGLRREQAKSRTALEEAAHVYAAGRQAGAEAGSAGGVDDARCLVRVRTLEIPLLPLYERGYSSIGCEPCTTLPLDPNDPRSGRWAGRKVECGIHIEAAPAS